MCIFTPMITHLYLQYRCLLLPHAMSPLYLESSHFWISWHPSLLVSPSCDTQLLAASHIPQVLQILPWFIITASSPIPALVLFDFFMHKNQLTAPGSQFLTLFSNAIFCALSTSYACKRALNPQIDVPLLICLEHLSLVLVSALSFHLLPLNSVFTNP